MTIKMARNLGAVIYEKRWRQLGLFSLMTYKDDSAELFSAMLDNKKKRQQPPIVL